ncbi:MAG: GspE/PulE family protein [Tissierellia bacterium]|nr:GspE/PulE family protein [Tissierellia bacterium]
MDNIIYCEEILKKALLKKASDIHIEPRSQDTVIRGRIGGDLYPLDYLKKEYHQGIISRFKILGDMDIAEKRMPQDGRFRFEMGEKTIDIRVSTIATVNGEKMVLRLLDPEKFEALTKEIGDDPEDMKEIEKMIQRNDGMILLTGPTGCGKTTTLYALLREEHRDDVNITTIENPVEYKIDGINQMQINELAGISFGQSLRSVLRQDPDIILIGEIRDQETAQIAVRASITGHKVYGTLHTTDTYSAVIRLLDMGIEAYLLQSALTGIISQRLMKKLCPKCKRKRGITEEEKFLFEPFHIEVQDIYDPVGCEECFDGYQGRFAVMEILPLDPDLKKEFSKDTSLDQLRQRGKERQIPTLFGKALEKVAKGVTSIEEAVKISME